MALNSEMSPRLLADMEAEISEPGRSDDMGLVKEKKNDGRKMVVIQRENIIRE